MLSFGGTAAANSGYCLAEGSGIAGAGTGASAGADTGATVGTGDGEGAGAGDRAGTGDGVAIGGTGVFLLGTKSLINWSFSSSEMVGCWILGRCDCADTLLDILDGARSLLALLLLRIEFCDAALLFLVRVDVRLLAELRKDSAYVGDVGEVPSLLTSKPARS